MNFPGHGVNTKSVDIGLNTNFLCSLGQILRAVFCENGQNPKNKMAYFWPKRVKMSFPGHGVNTKSVDIGLKYSSAGWR